MIILSQKTGLCRGISLLVAVMFMATSVTASPAGAPVMPARELSSDPFQKFIYSLPAEIGDVTNLETSSNRAPSGPRVVHIQDAHANPEAQRNICEILKFLTKQYPDLIIGTEGAAGPLHPEYLDLLKEFPEAGQAVADDLLEKGELTGAELFAWSGIRKNTGVLPGSVQRDIEGTKTEEHPAKVLGVEDAGLYRENLKTFRELLSRRDEIRSQLVPLRSRLETEASMTLNADLRDFLNERSRRKDGKYDADRVSGNADLQAYTRYLKQQVMKVLKIDLRDPLEQLLFPNLVRLLLAAEVRKEIDQAKAREDWKQVIAALTRMAEGDTERNYVRALESYGGDNGLIDVTAGGKAIRAGTDASLYPRKLLEQLYFFTKKQPQLLTGHEPFLKSFELLILQAEVDAAGLFQEMSSLETSMIEMLARTDAERELVRRIRGFDLFSKLLFLELTREEYRQIEPNRGILGSFIKNAPALRALFDRAEYFYVTAVKRDRALAENALSLAAKKNTGKQQVLVLITGGFHTGGIDALLREKRISCATLSPRIRRTDHGELYQKVMAGDQADLSAYFKVKNPFTTKQEALFFKEMLEIAAPVLSKKYPAEPVRVAAAVEQAVKIHPVLRDAVEAKSPQNGMKTALQFVPRTLTPQNAAIAADCITGEPQVVRQMESSKGEAAQGRAISPFVFNFDRNGSVSGSIVQTSAEAPASSRSEAREVEAYDDATVSTDPRDPLEILRELAWARKYPTVLNGTYEALGGDLEVLYANRDHGVPIDGHAGRFSTGFSKDLFDFCDSAEQNKEARLFLWKLGARMADRNFSKTGISARWRPFRFVYRGKPYSYRELFDAEPDAGPHLELAAGINIGNVFDDLKSAKGRFVFVDHSYFVEGYLNRVKYLKGLGNNIAILRADVNDTGKVFGEGSYRSARMSNVDTYVQGFPNRGFVEAMQDKVRGKIYFEKLDMVPALTDSDLKRSWVGAVLLRDHLSKDGWKAEFVPGFEWDEFASLQGYTAYRYAYILTPPEKSREQKKVDIEPAGRQRRISVPDGLREIAIAPALFGKTIIDGLIEAAEPGQRRRSEVRGRKETEGTILGPRRPMLGNILMLDDGTDRAGFQWDIKTNPADPGLMKRAWETAADFESELTRSYQGVLDSAGEAVSGKGLLSWILPETEAEVFNREFPAIFESQRAISEKQIDGPVPQADIFISHPVVQFLTAIQKDKERLIQEVRTAYDKEDLTAQEEPAREEDPATQKEERADSSVRASIAVSEVILLITDLARARYFFERDEGSEDKLKKLMKSIIEKHEKKFMVQMDRAVALQDFVKMKKEELAKKREAKVKDVAVLGLLLRLRVEPDEDQSKIVARILELRAGTPGERLVTSEGIESLRVEVERELRAINGRIKECESYLRDYEKIDSSAAENAAFAKQRLCNGFAEKVMPSSIPENGHWARRSLLRQWMDQFWLSIMPVRLSTSPGRGTEGFANWTDTAMTGEVFIRELMQALQETPQAANDGQEAPLSGGAEYVLVVPPHSTSAQVFAQMDRYGRQIKGIVGMNISGTTHWVILLRGRSYVPPVFQISEKEAKHLPGLQGAPVLIMPREEEGASLIVNPNDADLAEERRKREEFRLLEQAQKRLEEMPSPVPITVNSEAMGSTALNREAGLVRGDVIPPELNKALENLAEAIGKGTWDPEQWLKGFHGTERIAPEGLAEHFTQRAPRGKIVADSIHDILISRAMAYEESLGQEVASGKDVPIRTLDLQADSKNGPVLEMLAGIAKAHPGSGLQKDPSRGIQGFDFYENSSLGEMELVLELAAMIIAQRKAGEGRLVPLFPLILTHKQFRWIKDELWPLAQQVALWEIAGLSSDPESLEKARREIEKIGKEIRFGIMVEYMSLLTGPEMDRFLDDPDIVRLNVGNNDLTMDYWKTKRKYVDREYDASAFLLESLPEDLMVALEKLVFWANGKGKKVCFCGAVAESSKFLLALEWWRRQLNVPDTGAKKPLLSVSVAMDGVPRVSYALQVFRGIPEKELRAVFDGHRAESVSLDDLAKDLAHRYLSASERIAVLVEGWQQRYERAGFHDAFYRPNLDPENGIGGISEFVFLKRLMQTWLSQDLDELKALRLSEGGTVDRGEVQRILELLAGPKYGMVPSANVQDILEAFDFINSVKVVQRQLQENDPEKFNGKLYPAIMSEFVDAWVTQNGRPDWLSEGRSAQDIPAAGDEKEKQRIDDFFRHFHDQVESVSKTVRQTIHEVVKSFIHPIYREEEQIEGEKAPIVIRTRYGLVVSRTRGLIGGKRRYIHVREALKNFRRDPELMFRIFVWAAVKGAAISHSVQRAMETVVRENLQRFNERSGGLRGAFNRSFRDVMRTNGDIGYVMWRMEEVGLLDWYLPGFEELNQFLMGEESIFSVQRQTIRTLAALEDLCVKQQGYVYQRAADVYKKLRSDPDKAQLVRLAVLLHPIVEMETGGHFSVGNVRKITQRFLKELDMDTPGLQEKLIWLSVHQHPFFRHGFLSSRDILEQVTEVVKSMRSDKDLLSVLYAAAFARQIAVANPESRTMLARRGSNSPLANLDRFFLAGVEMSEKVPQSLESYASAMQILKHATEAVVTKGKGELLPPVKDLIAQENWRSVLEDYLSHTPGGKDAGLRKVLVSLIETTNGAFDELFIQFGDRVSTYYMRTLDAPNLLKHLFFFRHLLYLQETGDRATRATAFFPLPHQYHQAYEVVIGSAAGTTEDRALEARVLYENGFFVEDAVVKNSPKDPVGIRFLGFFPHENEMPQVQKNVVSQLASIFAPVPPGEKGTPSEKEIADIRFGRADEIYGHTVQVDKKDVRITNQGTKASFTDNEIYKKKEMSVLTIHSASADWRGQYLVLLTLLSRVLHLNIENLQFENLKGFPPMSRVFVTEKDGALLSPERQKVVARIVEKTLDMRSIIFGSGGTTVVGPDGKLVESSQPERSEVREEVVREFEVMTVKGIHARPSAKIVTLCEDYPGLKVEFEANGKKANGRELFELLTMNAGQHSIVKITVSGAGEVGNFFRDLVRFIVTEGSKTPIFEELLSVGGKTHGTNVVEDKQDTFESRVPSAVQRGNIGTFGKRKPLPNPIRKILLVDDDKSVLTMAKVYLEQEQFEVRAAGSGDAALRILKEFTPDVLLTDVFMPEKNGHILASEVVQQNGLGRLPVVFMSGYGKDPNPPEFNNVLISLSKQHPVHILDKMTTGRDGMVIHFTSVLKDLFQHPEEKFTLWPEDMMEEIAPQPETVHESAPESQEGKQRSEIRQSSGREIKAILLVDDHKDSPESVKGFLEADGFKVTVAASRLEALKVLETFTPDALLIDMLMSNFALEVVKKPGLEQVPVVFISGNTDGYTRNPPGFKDAVDNLAPGHQVYIWDKFFNGRNALRNFLRPSENPKKGLMSWFGGKRRSEMREADVERPLESIPGDQVKKIFILGHKGHGQEKLGEDMILFSPFIEALLMKFPNAKIHTAIDYQNIFSSERYRGKVYPVSDSQYPPVERTLGPGATPIEPLETIEERKNGGNSIVTAPAGAIDKLMNSGDGEALGRWLVKERYDLVFDFSMAPRLLPFFKRLTMDGALEEGRLPVVFSNLNVIAKNPGLNGVHNNPSKLHSPEITKWDPVAGTQTVEGMEDVVNKTRNFTKNAVFWEMVLRVYRALGLFPRGFDLQKVSHSAFRLTDKERHWVETTLVDMFVNKGVSHEEAQKIVFRGQDKFIYVNTFAESNPELFSEFQWVDLLSGILIPDSGGERPWGDVYLIFSSGGSRDQAFRGTLEFIWRKLGEKIGKQNLKFLLKAPENISIGQVEALMHAVDFVITPDTGFSHVATALNVPQMEFIPLRKEQSRWITFRDNSYIVDETFLSFLPKAPYAGNKTMLKFIEEGLGEDPRPRRFSVLDHSSIPRSEMRTETQAFGDPLDEALSADQYEKLEAIRNRLLEKNEGLLDRISGLILLMGQMSVNKGTIVYGSLGRLRETLGNFIRVGYATPGQVAFAMGTADEISADLQRWRYRDGPRNQAILTSLHEGLAALVNEANGVQDICMLWRESGYRLVPFSGTNDQADVRLNNKAIKDYIRRTAKLWAIAVGHLHHRTPQQQRNLRSILGVLSAPILEWSADPGMTPSDRQRGPEYQQGFLKTWHGDVELREGKLCPVLRNGVITDFQRIAFYRLDRGVDFMRQAAKGLQLVQGELFEAEETGFRRSELREPTGSFLGTLRKVERRGIFEKIVDQWVSAEDVPSIEFAARNAGDLYSERGITFLTGDPRKARLWIAGRLIRERQSSEGQISNKQLSELLDTVQKALPAGINVPSVTTAEDRPQLHLRVADGNAEEWAALVREHFPAVLGTLVRLHEKLVINVANADLERAIRAAVDQTARDNGIALGSGQVRVQISPEVPFVSLNRITARDNVAIASGSASDLGKVGRRKGVNSRWLLEGNIREDKDQFAAGIVTMLHAILDPNIARDAVHQPSEFQALLSASLTAVQAYAKVLASA